MLSLRALFLGLMAVLVAGFALGDETIPNWPAPAMWSPHSVSRGVSTMGSITSPLPFIGVTPCRILDTRNPAGPFGGPAFSSGETRSYTIASGPCSGIPTTAQAFSLNFTVVNMLPGDGFLTAWPAGSAQPVVSTLDYVPVEGAIANAAIVPTGSGDAISVFVNVGTNVIIDINGYYGAGIGTENVFLGPDAGNLTMTGFGHNTGIGSAVLQMNTTGYINTGVGARALSSNTSGAYNTGLGSAALTQNSTGGYNTAVGTSALFFNTAGGANAAVGVYALNSNTVGVNNTAIGGVNALNLNTTGSSNTAAGAGALHLNTTGSGNTAVGISAGSNLTTGDDNIDIGNPGVAGESGVIRIGSGLTATATFLAGVHGVTTGGVAIPVMIDASGQLGTVSSSARFKDEIQDMGEATEALLKLRPVTFRYKAQPEGRTQFGLIAEEVEKVMPELVVCSSDGEVETVLYHEMPAMLLNEVQKQQREIQKQQREIQELKSELSALRAVIGQK